MSNSPGTNIFDERWYALEIEKLRVHSTDDFRKKAWDLPDQDMYADPSRLFNIARLGLTLIQRHAKSVDAICRTIQLSRCGEETLDFISGVLELHVLDAITERKTLLLNVLSDMRPFYDTDDIKRAQEHVETEWESLVSEIKRDYEIERLSRFGTQLAVIPVPENKASRRLSLSVVSPIAARRMEEYLKLKGLSQTEFATMADTTDRTIRTFRREGKVRRSVFENIAKAMGLDKSDLLRPE